MCTAARARRVAALLVLKFERAAGEVWRCRFDAAPSGHQIERGECLVI